MEKADNNDFWVKGPIPASVIPNLYNTNNGTAGANAIFLGIIRSDTVEGNQVREIEYSAYRKMAEKTFDEIQKQVCSEHKIVELTILHSIGTVKAGETSMLIFVASKHRAAAFAALRQAVELIKEKAPVWKKEIYEDETHIWVNA